MNQSKSGLYHYIHSLFQKGALADRPINHVINDEHHGYCFMNFYIEFPFNRQNTNTAPKQFFHGLIFHNHHFSIEKNYQITRIHYRYKKEVFGFKGELDFNNSALLSQNLAKIFKKPPKALNNSEFISLQQLINFANLQFNLRFKNLLKDYHKTYASQVKTLKNKIQRYSDCKQQFNTGNFRNLDLAHQAIDEWDDIINILNKIPSFLEPDPLIMGLKYYEEQKKHLINDMEFAHYDNLCNLENDLENKKICSELVAFFINQNISPSKDMTENVKRIKLVKIFFKTSPTHVKTLTKNLCKTEHHENLETNPILEMFIQKNFHAFSLYLYQTYISNLKITLKMMQSFSMNTPDEKEYFQLIQKKINP